MARSLLIRIGLGFVWLLAIGGGFAVILNYESRQGAAGHPIGHWPAHTQIMREPTGFTLLMFAHPQCPCTKASIEELNRLMARCHGDVRAQVWFFKPKTLPADWAKTGLWRSAGAIPGVTTHEDVDGAQARLFGVETSGHVLLYDTSGELRFTGGITSARGHAGDNLGENTIIALVARQHPVLASTQVYGCSLLGECKLQDGTQ